MKLNELLKKMNTKVKIIIIAILVLIIAGLIAYPFLHTKESTIDTTYLGSILEKKSELTTAQITYTGISEFKDEGTLFLNKQDFTMVYSAKARIGIDVKDIKINSNEESKKITITMPKASVQDVNVDTESIKYYNTKFALFNTNQKEDSNKAIALAKKEAEKEVLKLGVLEMANSQAKDLIKGIISDSVPDDYKIEFKVK